MFLDLVNQIAATGKLFRSIRNRLNPRINHPAKRNKQATVVESIPGKRFRYERKVNVALLAGIAASKGAKQKGFTDRDVMQYEFPQIPLYNVNFVYTSQSG